MVSIHASSIVCYTALLALPHPAVPRPGLLCPALTQHWWCRYKRDDGIDMTATLYLPPAYDKDKDGPLPCLMWAYPKEFKSKDAAGSSLPLAVAAELFLPHHVNDRPLGLTARWSDMACCKAANTVNIYTAVRACLY